MIPRRGEAVERDRDLGTRQGITTTRARALLAERATSASATLPPRLRFIPMGADDLEEALVVINNQETSQRIQRWGDRRGEAPARAAVRAGTQYGFLPTGRADARRP